jgi:hypothetical protein
MAGFALGLENGRNVFRKRYRGTFPACRLTSERRSGAHHPDAREQ